MLEQQLKISVFGGLSDSLQVAIDIQNESAVSAVLVNCQAAHAGGELSDAQWAELLADARDAGYEFM